MRLDMITLLDTESIVGIIVAIALFSLTLVVCFYLLSLKDKNRDNEDGPKQK